jgi:hypothetical protein
MLFVLVREQSRFGLSLDSPRATKANYQKEMIWLSAFSLLHRRCGRAKM